jgi:hypothetical protein
MLKCFTNLDSQFYKILLFNNTCKDNFKNESLKIVTYISKHNITNDKQKHWPLKSYNNKKNHLIMINNDLNDDIIDNNVIDYWHKELQLTKNDENIFLSPNG